MRKILILLLLATPLNAARKSIGQLCEQVDKKFSRLGLNGGDCPKVNWEYARRSHLDYPLINKRFGKNPEKVVVLICGVHGDEHSSPYFCFRLAEELEKIEKQDPSLAPNIAVAPLGNPDGFFAGTRTNHHGVDINRNFPTKKFKSDAMKEWARYGKKKRRYPGTKIEPETVFQQKLISVYTPIKIVSIHSPLNFIDYDGPSAKWAVDVAGKHKKIPFKNYRTFVGSLGRYAGEELGIPTYTIELTHSTYKKKEIDLVYTNFRDWLIELIKVGDGKHIADVEK